MPHDLVRGGAVLLLYKLGVPFNGNVALLQEILYLHTFVWLYNAATTLFDPVALGA